MNPVPVKIQKLHMDVNLPARQTPGAAAYDVFAYCPAGIEIPPGESRLIPTGFKLEVSPAFFIEIRPRSGLSTKNSLIMPNSAGTIDSDYRGEVFVPLFNLGKNTFKIEHKMRIGQMLVIPVYSIDWIETEDLSETQRATGGFGSTG